MPERRRQVVITGLGPVTAMGLGMEPLWTAMREGRSGIKRIERFDPSGFPCQAGAEVANEQCDVRSLVPKSYRKATKVMARDIELAVGAASAAVADAGLTTKATNPDAPPTIPASHWTPRQRDDLTCAQPVETGNCRFRPSRHRGDASAARARIFVKYGDEQTAGSAAPAL
jgi:hypothetical protein